MRIQYGIDAAKRAVKPEALAWIRPQRSLRVPVKTCGETRNDGRWTLPLP